MYYSFSPSTLPAPQVQLHSTLFKSGELANTVKSMQKCGNRVVFDLPVSTELTRRLLKHCISLKLLRMFKLLISGPSITLHLIQYKDTIILNNILCPAVRLLSERSSIDA